MRIVATGLNFSDLKGHLRGRRKAGAREVLIAVFGESLVLSGLLVASIVVGGIVDGSRRKKLLARLPDYTGQPTNQQQ